MSQQLKQAYFQQSHNKDQPKPKKQLMKQLQIKDLPSPSIFNHTESRIILFSYNPNENQESPCQILLLEQASKKTKGVNEEQQVQQMMNKFGIQSQVEEKLFLKKINNQERLWLTRQINDLNECRNIAYKQGIKDRLQRRRSKFESSSIRRQAMNTASPEVMAERRIKVVNMNSLMKNYNKKEVIQLGNQEFIFQDLSQTNQKQEYYALIKKRVNTDETFPHLTIPVDLLSKIQFEAQGMSEQQDVKNDDDFDSNDEDNPNYDYPDEQQEQQRSRSSQGIIRDYDEDYDYDRHQSDAEDEEEIYNKYLRRVRRKQQEMEPEDYYQQYD